MRLFLMLYIPAAFILFGLVYGLLRIETGIQLDGIQIREASQVEIASHVMGQDLEAVASDLMVLARAPSFKHFLELGNAANKLSATELFVEVAKEKQIYDQIRYLDATGMEIVRINRSGGAVEVVPDAELQDKNGRYFFQDSIRLSEGEVYVSPLDLNVERGKVEMPYKPMVRFGTPVFNHAGRKMGVVITNVYGSKLIEHFREAMAADRHAMLLNRDGDWLSSPDPSQEWGFMFGNAHAFAQRYPVEWKNISAGNKGSFMTEAGLFTYATVYPLLTSQRSSTGSPLPEGASSHKLERQEYFWKAVSFVPAEELPSAKLFRNPAAFAAYGIGLMLLAALFIFLSLTLISRRQLRQSVFDNERRLREITSTLGEGLYVLNAEGIITYVNPEAERLLGWSQEGLLGKHAHDLFHHHLENGTALPESECAINKVIRSGCAYRNEEEVFWRKDGTKIPVAVSSSPIVREGMVVGSVVAFQDATERKRSQEEIRHLAYYDTLTELPNRRLLLDRLGFSLVQAKRNQRSLAVMFLDLDGFKEINDTLGHDVGDELLKTVAARLNAVLRGGDMVARQGGDEFVIILPEIAQPDDATQVAEKLLQAMRTPVLAKGHTLQVTGSIGISIYPVDGTDDMHELMKKADMAMYAAKQAGRDRYCVHGK